MVLGFSSLICKSQGKKRLKGKKGQVVTQSLSKKDKLFSYFITSAGQRASKHSKKICKFNFSFENTLTTVSFEKGGSGKINMTLINLFFSRKSCLPVAPSEIN